MSNAHGLLLIDKPTGLTSHNVVARVRRALGTKKVGHAGTLDPMATGLLVVGVGVATRLLQYCQASNKRYTGTVKFGVATDSLDADGVVVGTARVPAFDADGLNEAARAMCGETTQIPPMVSALKRDGKRLYELARQGIEVERAPRPVTISDFSLSPTADPSLWNFDVTCSVGTYVRVLLSDLAESLGTLGHLTALRREASGDFLVSEALTLDELDERTRVGDTVLAAPREMVRGFVTVTATDEEVLAVRRGQRPTFVTEADDVAVLDRHGALIGLARRRDDSFQPYLVLAADEAG